MATLFQEFQFFDGNGDPLTGGKLHWYEAGTTTEKDTYIDQAESGAAPNPIELDDEGRPDLGAIWIRGSYKLKITDSADVEIVTIDDINEYNSQDFTGLTASIADLNSTTSSTIAKSGDYAILIGDRNKTIIADATSATFTLTLPNAATVGNTFRIYTKLVNINNNSVLLQPVGGAKIDDLSTISLHDYHDLLGLQSDGSNWHIIAYQRRGPTSVASGTGTLTLTLKEERWTFLVDVSAGQKTINLPVATDVGRGFRIKIKKTDSSSNAVVVNAQGSETIDTFSDVHINVQFVCYGFVTDGANWHIETGFELDVGSPYPKGYLHGYVAYQDAGDPQHDIGVTAGDARDHGNTTNMIRSSHIVKQIDNTWVEGTNQGGRPGTVTLSANKWYHYFLIAVPGTNSQIASKVDAGFDETLTPTKLLAVAGSFGYTKYRYVYSVLTNASKEITSFKVFDYGMFRESYWVTLITDANKTGSGPSTGSVVLRVPPDLHIRTKINVSATNDSGDSIDMYFHNTAQASQQPKTPSLNPSTKGNGIMQISLRDNIGRQANCFEITTSTAKAISYNIGGLAGGIAWQFDMSTSSWIVNLAT